MRVISRWGGIALTISIAVVALDQITKAWVLGGLDLGDRLSIELWGPFRFTLVENRGVSFGLFQSDSLVGRYLLASFSIAVVVCLAIWVRRTDRRLRSISIGLIMGGAVGNAIDRLRFGSVVDFVDVQRLFFPWVFNLADSAITIGIALLVLETFITPKEAHS